MLSNNVGGGGGAAFWSFPILAGARRRHWYVVLAIREQTNLCLPTPCWSKYGSHFR